MEPLMPPPIALSVDVEETNAEDWVPLVVMEPPPNRAEEAVTAPEAVINEPPTVNVLEEAEIMSPLKLEVNKPVPTFKEVSVAGPVVETMPVVTTEPTVATLFTHT